jgi:ATP-binding protein involved in chromosome partitioning
VSRLRTYHELTGDDRSGLGGQVDAQHARIASRLASVRNVVAVMSGKGGVGKSFVTAGLAAALARAGRATGVLDADLHGPTVARMLGASQGRLAVGNEGVEPAVASGSLRVMSSDLLLPEGAPLRWEEPGRSRHVWRGTLEAGVLREFLSDVRWGALDVLLVDLPPGRDRLDALVELLPRPPGVVVVTIPSEASFRSVRRSLEAAREAGLPIHGVIENMAGYRCAGCAGAGPLFRGDAGERLAREAGAPLLARVPFDPRAQDAVDAGDPGAAADALSVAVSSLLSRLEAA